MKVLQINTVCGQGSTGRIAVDLYKILEEEGHECVIAYGRGGAPKGISAIKIGNDFNIYMHGILTRFTDRHGFYSAYATNKFIKEIEAYDPDIIHLHNLHGYYINIEILFEYLAKVNKPVVWTLHDCWAFTGHCAYFDFVGCDRWRTGCFNCPQKGTYPKSIGIDNSRENYQMKKTLFQSIEKMVIVTPSNWLAGLVKQSFLSKYPVKVIPNGIDLSIFKPTKSNFREKYRLQDKIIILGVANIWEKRKGLDDFITLANEIDEKYKIVLVGLNSEQIKEIPQNLIGLERTESVEELVEIYSAADVFLNPTYEDNFPTTNLEALACGTPVITYDTGGSPESLDDNCGIVVEKNNFVQLVKIIHDKKWSLLNGKCVENVQAYDRKIKYVDYISLYKSARMFICRMQGENR